MKKAFTLVEIIISIFLFSLIMIFLYKSISTIQINNKNFRLNSQKNLNLTKTISLLKKDLILSNNIKIKKIDKNFNNIKLKTKNSIYNFAYPTVEWLVLKKSQNLVRVEYVNHLQKHLLSTGIKCKIFKIYKSIKNNQKLIYLKLVNNQEIILESY